MLASPGMHVRFLLMTLGGGTKKLFRKHYMDHQGITYADAKKWLTANCTARDSKEKLLKEMKFLKMNDKETVQVRTTNHGHEMGHQYKYSGTRMYTTCITASRGTCHVTLWDRHVVRRLTVIYRLLRCLNH
eukprot:SAG31_NODE_10139_length_1178_cov_9.705283_1_plen_131_part_00